MACSSAPTEDTSTRLGLGLAPFVDFFEWCPSIACCSYVELCVCVRVLQVPGNRYRKLEKGYSYCTTRVLVVLERHAAVLVLSCRSDSPCRSGFRDFCWHVLVVGHNVVCRTHTHTWYLVKCAMRDIINQLRLVDVRACTPAQTNRNNQPCEVVTFYSTNKKKNCLR
jgi:hypothetical protein